SLPTPAVTKVRRSQTPERCSPVTEPAENNVDEQSGDFFDQLVQGQPREQQGAFTIGFRGYDRGEVDAAIAGFRMQLERADAEVAEARSGLSRDVESVRTEAEAIRAESDARIAEIE